jgi:hypothetical protein
LEIMRRFLLSNNLEYEKSLQDWHEFLAMYVNKMEV